MTNQLRYSELLGRKIRVGSAADLSKPTRELALTALREGDAGTAREYLDYAIVESCTMLDFISEWLTRMLEIGLAEIPGFEEQISRLTSVIGAPPPILDASHQVGRETVERALAALDRRDTGEFDNAFSVMLEAQMQVIDAQTDWAWGLLTVFRDILGEERLGEIQVTTMSHVADRYDAFDMPLDELVALTVEGMRAIHTGPGRSGRVDVTEEPDRWVLTFDPCGSGGRMRRGDAARAQTPRTEAPYNFGVTEEAHDWSWGEKGVCLYCTHCCVSGELMPIDRNGFPMRVTEHPREADQPCRFLIYKGQELIPDWAYEHVGRQPPRSQ